MTIYLKELIAKLRHNLTFANIQLDFHELIKHILLLIHDSITITALFIRTNASRLHPLTSFRP